MKLLGEILTALSFITTVYSFEQGYELLPDKSKILTKITVSEKHPGVAALEELQKLPSEIRPHFEGAYPLLKEIKTSNLTIGLANQALEAQALYEHYAAMQEKDGSLIIPPAYAFVSHKTAKNLASILDLVKKSMIRKKDEVLPSHVIVLLSDDADLRAQCAYALRRYFDRIEYSDEPKKPIPYEFLDLSIPKKKLLVELQNLNKDFSTLVVKDCGRITAASSIYELLWKAHSSSGKTIILIANSYYKFSLNDLIKDKLPQIAYTKVNIDSSNCTIL